MVAFVFCFPIFLIFFSACVVSASTFTFGFIDFNLEFNSFLSTTREVGEAANEFLRMGESIETTNELIRSSQVLSKTGMIESADAASYLISSLKGYQPIELQIGEATVKCLHAVADY